MNHQRAVTFVKPNASPDILYAKLFPVTVVLVVDIDNILLIPTGHSSRNPFGRHLRGHRKRHSQHPDQTHRLSQPYADGASEFFITYSFCGGGGSFVQLSQDPGRFSCSLLPFWIQIGAYYTPFPCPSQRGFRGFRGSWFVVRDSWFVIRGSCNNWGCGFLTALQKGSERLVIILGEAEFLPLLNKAFALLFKQRKRFLCSCSGHGPAGNYLD